MSLPVLPASFYWSESHRGPLLRCRPLDAVATHFFTTRQLQLSSHDDWSAVAALAGAEAVVNLNQVHGREVVVVRRDSPTPDRSAGDILVSDHPPTALAVRAADCVPLLLADSEHGVVAAVHAGWRGTAAGAAVAAVEALAREFGSRPDSLIAAIGPAIRPCCYEVGSELVDAFASAGHARHLVDRWFSIRGSGPGREGSLVLDVAGSNRDQLVLAGVPETSIFDCGLCTAMHLDVLTSYRAEKERAGRLAAVIRPSRG